MFMIRMNDPEKRQKDKISSKKSKQKARNDPMKKEKERQRRNNPVNKEKENAANLIRNNSNVRHTKQTNIIISKI